MNIYKHLVILLPMVLFLYNCEGQEKGMTKPIGIGLLTANTQSPLPLYKTEKDTTPVDVLKFKVEKSGVTKFMTKINLKPYELSIGDSHEAGKTNTRMGLIRFPPILRFRVVDSTDTFFKVITNEETLETLIIKRDNKNAYYISERERFDNNCVNCPSSKYNPAWYIFETWERFLKRVEFITKKDLKIYDTPDGKIIFENNNNAFLPFGVTEVKGEWIKLKKGFGREFNFDDKKNYNGWTKWREGETMLIGITEHTYE